MLSKQDDMKSRPPKYALDFLRFFCKESYIEEIEGDIWELFDRRVETIGLARARGLFIWDVLRSFRWINLKKVNMNWMSRSLLNNFFKIGIRNIFRERAYSLLNVVGLSLGLSIFLILIHYVRHEFSFDTFIGRSDRTYRIIQVFNDSHGENPRPATSINLASALKEELSVVKEATNFVRGMPTWVDIGDNRFFEENNTLMASPEFFKVFDYKILDGEVYNPLEEPYTMVISKNQALKYFDRLDVVGQTIDFERYGQFRITGVMEDVPANSYLQFAMVLSQNFDRYFDNVAPWFPQWFQSWRGSPARTYVVLHDPEQKAEFEQQLPALLRKYKGANWQENPYYLQNVLDQHFYSTGINGQWQANIQGNIQQIRVFAIIAVLMLLIACFNYINLATARATRRAKEVGVRKAIGAMKRQLVVQFLSESLLIVIMALGLGVLLSNLFLPYFEQITQVSLSMDLNAWLEALPSILLTMCIVGLLGGLYPAFYLSRFDPAGILKSHRLSVQTNTKLRHGLVSFQFVLVIFVMVAMIVIQQQMSFMSDRSLGFDKDQLMVVEINGGNVRDNFATIKSELQTHPNVLNVAGMTRVVSSNREPVSVELHPPTEVDAPVAVDFYGMDEDGITTLGLNLLAGAPFTGAYAKDSSSVFLNEEAAKLVGGTSVIGQWIQLGDNFRAQVIGILENFHYRSMHESIGPLVIGHVYNPFESIDDIVIKIRPEGLIATVQFVESVHNKFDENAVMSATFVDDLIQSFYEKELLFRRIFSAAAFFSLLIALLGIIGLAAYTANTRAKDFGIRKVFGASFFDIIRLQWMSYWKPLGIAFFIAGIVSWYVLANWLKNFAYRIDLTLLPLLIAFAVVTLITLITVLGVGYRMARQSSVKALRHE